MRIIDISAEFFDLFDRSSAEAQDVIFELGYTIDLDDQIDPEDILNLIDGDFKCYASKDNQITLFDKPPREILKIMRKSI